MPIITVPAPRFTDCIELNYFYFDTQIEEEIQGKSSVKVDAIDICFMRQFQHLSAIELRIGEYENLRNKELLQLQKVDFPAKSKEGRVITPLKGSDDLDSSGSAKKTRSQEKKEEKTKIKQQYQ